MNKKLLIGLGVVVLIIFIAFLSKYIGYDIGYERAAETLSEGEMVENEFIEITFSLKLPSGWKKVNEESVNENAPGDYNLIEYEDENGNYFSVYYDSGRFGDLGVGDSLWSLEMTLQNGIRIVSEEELCKTKNEVHSLYYCSPDDNRLDILGEGASGILEIASHTYYFRFGNIAGNNNVDLGAFRDILASFRAR